MELVEPSGFTKGVSMRKIDARDDFKRVPNHDGDGFEDAETRLYDLAADPLEKHPFRDPAIERRLLDAAAAVMRDHEAPPEMFERFALTPAG